MNYKIVNLKEKIAVGLSARTSNADPKAGEIIGGLWSSFYNGGVYSSVRGKINDKVLGIYTDYSSDEKGEYTVSAACEVKALLTDNTLSVFKIPEGKYAEFIVKGDVKTAVAKAWAEIWNTPLPRAFICDFEEYQNNDMNNSEIHIYIGLKE